MARLRIKLPPPPPPKLTPTIIRIPPPAGPKSPSMAK